MWNVSDSIAQLSTGRLAGSLDLSRPIRGLSPSEPRLTAIRQMLGVWFSEQSVQNKPHLSTAHVRGADLVARYAEDEGTRVRQEIYWRALDQSPSDFGVELIASVQTSQLTSQPRLATHSRIDAAEILFVELPLGGACRSAGLENAKSVQLEHAASFFLFRVRNAMHSYCEMVQPSDFVSSTVRLTSQQNLVEVSHQLFSNSLEKGVIRRARVQGIFVPRQQDVGHAQAHFNEFAASKPVLSA